jgi:hypothetical protein
MIAGRDLLPAFHTPVQLRHKPGNLQQAQLKMKDRYVVLWRFLYRTQRVQEQTIQRWVRAVLYGETVHQFGKVKGLGGGLKAALQDIEGFQAMGLSYGVHITTLGQGQVNPRERLQVTHLPTSQLSGAPGHSPQL